MRIQKYVLLSTAAIVTFLIGWSAYTGFRYVGSLFFPASAVMPTALTKDFAADAILAAEISGEPLHETEELNLTGEYYLFEQTLPKGIHDFDYIEIFTHEYVSDEEGGPWIPIPPKGSLQTKRNHKLTSVSVSPDFVTFETESIKGIHYRFIGKYHHYEYEEGGGTIRGTLTKLENRRIIAKMDVTLIQGGC